VSNITSLLAMPPPYATTFMSLLSFLPKTYSTAARIKSMWQVKWKFTWMWHDMKSNSLRHINKPLRRDLTNIRKKG
jgi:hypothetical protein